MEAYYVPCWSSLKNQWDFCYCLSETSARMSGLVLEGHSHVMLTAKLVPLLCFFMSTIAGKNCSQRYVVTKGTSTSSKSLLCKTGVCFGDTRMIKVVLFWRVVVESDLAEARWSRPRIHHVYQLWHTLNTNDCLIHDGYGSMLKK